VSAGKALGEGVEKGAKESLARAKSAVRQEINDLQMQYEAAVAKGWSFKPSALTGMKTLGISLFPSDRELLAEVSAETARLQAALKAGDASSSMAAAAAEDMRKVSLARGKAQLAAFKEATVAANAQIVAEAKAAQLLLDAQLQAIYARGARQSVVATAQATGGYSVLSTGKEVTPEVADPVKVGSSTEALKKQSSALKQFAQHANEAHSAARGLASGLGLLWLTWGSMVPLLAGAAISNAVVQMVKLGAAVEQTMAIIGTLGGEGAEGVKALHAELLKVSSGGVFGPLAVAEALKTMAMAGLDAKQQIAALGAVLQFAQLGEMPTKQAAETLAAIAQAFGYSARDWSRVGDIITATAAATTATIADMSAAFKSSSVVAQEYGVSLTDAAAALGVLNQIGIRGSAGGTAMRQMYNELIGSSAQARKTIEALGIQVMTADKQALRPFREITLEVVKGLSGLNGLGQMRALQSMMNERGMKAEVAAMAAYRAEQKALGKSSEETILGLQQLMDKIADSPGIMAIATAQLAHSSENLMKGVKSSLQTSLVEAFDALQPTLAQISLSLTRSFGSAEFKSALVSLADGVATFTRVVVENFNAIANLAQAYVLWRVGLAGVTMAAGVASTVLTALAAAKAAAALGASGLAAGATSLANAVLGTSVAFTGLQLALGAVGIVIVAVGAALAYMAFKEGEADRARRERVASLAAGSAITEKALDDEIARLTLLIKKMKEGGTEQQAQAEARTALVLAEISERYAILKATEQQIIASNQEAIAKERAAGGGKSGPVDTTAVYVAALGQAELRLRELNKEEFKSLERISAKTSAVKTLAREYADAADKAAKANLASPKGTADFNKPTKPGPVHASDYNFTKDVLTEEKARHTAMMQELKREATEEKQIIDAKHKARLISEAEFQQQSLMATIKEDNKQRDAIDQGWSERNRLISNAMNEIAKEAGGFEVVSEAAKKQGEAFAGLDPKMKALAEGYRKLMVDQGLSNTTFEKEVATLKQVIVQREALLAIEFQGKIAAEAKAYKDLGREMGTSLQKQRDKLDLEQRMESMNSVQRAGAQAELAFEEQSAQAIAKRTEALQEFVATQAALKAILDSQTGTTVDVDPTGELAKRYDEASEAIKVFAKALQDAKDKVLMGGGISRSL
jgi:TP901 family phage tail tape measure protein